MNGWFQRRCAHANCGFQAGKGSQPSNKKQREIPPKKQAGSYIVEYLFKLDDVIHMLLLEKHISFGFLYVLLTWPILAKSLRWEDRHLVRQEGCLAMDHGWWLLKVVLSLLKYECTVCPEKKKNKAAHGHPPGKYHTVDGSEIRLTKHPNASLVSRCDGCYGIFSLQFPSQNSHELWIDMFRH